jgi:hypothetical protein
MATAKALWLLLFTVVLIHILNCSAGAATENAGPVVVELFTSEACSSCPPADALLISLNERHIVNGTEVLVLGEHVDYFNHLGWSDRFSSSLFSERQNAYAQRFHLPSPYTPQIVIDGSFEVLGSDAASVEQEIGRAARTKKTLDISLNWAGQNTLRVNATGPSAEPLAVLLAIAEDELTTSVAGGENKGRVLRHAGVVRELRQLGTTLGGRFAGTAEIVPANGWKRSNLQVVVFAQRPGSREIVGAAALALPR